MRKRESEWTFWAIRPREAPLTADARHTRAMTIALFIWESDEDGGKIRFLYCKGLFEGS